MDPLSPILALLCLIAGSVFLIIGGIGLLRLPDLFTRLHAAGVTDTLGAGLILLGLMLHAGFSQSSAKLLLIVIFLLFTSPTASHALAKAARHGGLVPRLYRSETPPSNRS
ncbi:MAG: monovalent cation/H(+) antiporter subunit G [Gammaproteobacteria bacterium]|nr:monovalent cation/H(+) antiporter subunit G [Gammaproteobacteria bacterium]